MNAVICEKYEARVLTNDTIEVHLQYLRTGLDGVQTALPVLRDKIDQLSTTVDAKIEKTNDRIDALNKSLSDRIEAVNPVTERQNRSGQHFAGARIDAVNTSLTQQIKETNSRIEAVNTSLSEKMSTVATGLAELRGYVKTVSWVLGLVSTVAAVLSIARTFDWI